MITQTVAQIVLEVIRDFMTEGKVFTAWDVTAEARRRSPQENIEHREVRNIVHQEYFTGGMTTDGGAATDYNREENVELAVGGNPQVIVYYPDGKSAADHPKVLQNPAPVGVAGGSTGLPGSANTVPTVQPSSTSKKGGHEQDDDGNFILHVTAEGRVNIPTELLSKLPSTADGSYDFISNGSLHPLKPNSDGRIRFTPKEMAINADAVKITISMDRTAINVDAHNTDD